MIPESIYHVWRRHDGYVGVTKGRTPPRDEGRFTFEHLVSTPDWDVAVNEVEAHRAGPRTPE